MGVVALRSGATPTPYTSEALHEAATRLGLKVGFKHIGVAELGQLTLPCIGVVKPVPPSAEAAAISPDDPKVTPIAAARGADKPPAEDLNAHGMVLIVSANADNVAFFDGTSPNAVRAPAGST